VIANTKKRATNAKRSSLQKHPPVFTKPITISGNPTKSFGSVDSLAATKFSLTAFTAVKRGERKERLTIQSSVKNVIRCRSGLKKCLTD
jgi:hypothetical protein